MILLCPGWQVRRAKARYRAKQRETARAKLRLKIPGWVLPPEPPADEPALEEEQRSTNAPTTPEPATTVEPRSPRRAVRAEPTHRTHGPNRGGESARSWQPKGERNPTGLPIDVADFMREEF